MQQNSTIYKHSSSHKTKKLYSSHFSTFLIHFWEQQPPKSLIPFCMTFSAFSTFSPWHIQIPCFPFFLRSAQFFPLLRSINVATILFFLCCQVFYILCSLFSSSFFAWVHHQSSICKNSVRKWLPEHLEQDENITRIKMSLGAVQQ